MKSEQVQLFMGNQTISRADTPQQFFARDFVEGIWRRGRVA
ncbi:MAG: hypothetical protein G01um101429_775 [Parcubacteria group bacterium Gr01-1014_29]|nr:MAG: hypothetical protein G01um101429_775 [Parcubacteria group bacterium Gr01-1014_29]